MTKSLILGCISTIMVLSGCSPTESNQAQISQLESYISNHLIELEQTPTGALSLASLEAIAEQIGEHKIVALGEQTHGVSEVFSAKVELIKYLNEHHDFDLIVLESGIYDVAEIWRQAQLGKSIKPLAPGNIFYMYANSDEVTPLFDFMEKKAQQNDSAVFLGFDSQHTGAISNAALLEDLENNLKLAPKDWTAEPIWFEFKAAMQDVLNVSTEHPTSAQQTQWLELLDQMSEDIEAFENGYWYRILRGLKAQAQRQWQIVDHRSVEMGNNINWLAKQYPDKKMIVWAHTGHLQKSSENAGSTVAEQFYDDYYVIQFTAHQGQYLDFVDLSNKSVSTPKPGSLEYTIPQLTNQDYAYLPINDELASLGNTHAYIYNYSFSLPADQWRHFWDGIVFIKRISPASYPTSP